MNAYKICPRCGTQLDIVNNFCPKCGLNTQENNNQYQMPKQGSYFSVPNAKAKRSDSIVSVIAFLIAFIGCGYFSIVGIILAIIDLAIGKKDKGHGWSKAAIGVGVCWMMIVFVIVPNGKKDKTDDHIANVQTEIDPEKQAKTMDQKNKLKDAVESIGMDYSNIKNIQQLDDWTSGKRYSFVYDGFRYIVYELGNGEIESINTEFKRAKIYERGYKPLNYKDFEPDIDVLNTLQSDLFERISEYVIGETSIKSKVGSMMYSRIYDYYSISGEVKAKNAVSKKNFTFTVDYIVNADKYECVYLAIDGNIAFGSNQTPKIEKKKLKTQNNSQNGEAMVLSYGKEGEFGQYDLFDGESYLRYYVPAGDYKVKCNIRGGFYVETIELHKEDGWDTPTTIHQIDMTDGEEIEITIEEGQCISLYINTEIELKKSNI